MENKIVKDNEQTIKKIEEILQSGLDSNQKFNEAINGEQLIKINGLSAEREPYEYTPSEVLFWVDRNAYYDELENFESGEAQERHNELIEFLFETEQDSVFEELKEAIGRKRIVPFVGAGSSKAFDFPTWAEALESINKSLGNVDGVEELLKQFNFLEAAEILFQKNQTIFNDYIRAKFPLGAAKKDEIIKRGIPRLLPKITTGCVITTNYDHVIEEVFESESKAFQGYMRGVNQNEKFVSKLIKNDRCILKLHGDYEFENSYIFSQSQYKNAYNRDGVDEIDFTKPLPKTLRQIYISNSMLFLGCSLEQDKTLDLFKQVKTENQFEIPEHYAILENKEPDNVQWMVNTKSRLLELNIRPIWYQKGKHEHLEQLLSLVVELVDKKVNFKRKKS